MPELEFYRLVESTFTNNTSIDLFISHETPALPGSLDQPATIGKSMLYKLIHRFQPRVHIYGHCHHHDIYRQINRTLFINVDARVLIFTNQDIKIQTLYH